MGAMKVLLLGSAPCLLEQLPGIFPEAYEIVAVVNDWTNATTRELLAARRILPNYYFFSDGFFFDLGRSEAVFKMPQQKVMCVPAGRRVNNRKFSSEPGYTSVTEALKARGVAVNPRETARFLSDLGGYGRGTWPSTGLLALGYLLLDMKVASVELAGFSFFQGRTHYYDDAVFDRKRHSVAAELRIFEYFSSRGLCSVVARGLSAKKPPGVLTKFPREKDHALIRVSIVAWCCSVACLSQSLRRGTPLPPREPGSSPGESSPWGTLQAP